VLDKSALVMIDAVGTGLSHAVCDHKDNEFWAVDPDIDSISRFIAQYVSHNNRTTMGRLMRKERFAKNSPVVDQSPQAKLIGVCGAKATVAICVLSADLAIEGDEDG
jgi:hypothetical protein